MYDEVARVGWESSHHSAPPPKFPLGGGGGAEVDAGMLKGGGIPLLKNRDFKSSNSFDWKNSIVQAPIIEITKAPFFGKILISCVSELSNNLLNDSSRLFGTRPFQTIQNGGCPTS